jgi:hypothetical protein
MTADEGELLRGARDGTVNLTVKDKRKYEGVIEAAVRPQPRRP